MNRTLLALATAAAFAAIAAPAAAPAAHEGADPAASHTSTAPVQAVGIVRKVDPAQGKVTLQHEPIASLGWPAMTMAFRVGDPKLLDGLVPGRKVHFAFVQQGSAYMITAIQ